MKRALAIVLTLVIVLVWYFAIFGEKGVIKIVHLRQQRDRLTSEAKRIREENERLKKEIGRLQDDPQYLESVVRRELGFVKENEVLFIFEDGAVEKTWDED